MSRRFLTGLVAIPAASLGLTWLLAPVAADVTYLWADVLPVNPYFVPDHFLRLYTALPLLAVASVHMLLAPGVLLVIARGGEQAARWTGVVPRGFLVSYGLRVFVHSVAKLAGASLTPALFWSVELALLAATASILTWRWRGGHVAVPAGPPRRLALVGAIPALVTLVLIPQIFWQDLTVDGLEALEIGWSLKDFIVPRFPNDTGFMGLGIGMLSMAPPVSWFIQMLGPTEAAARLPLVLYLPVVAFLLIGLAEHGRDRELDRTGEAMILLVLTGLVAVMAFSATYDAYSADVSAPTAFETLTLACLAGALLALWEGRRVTFFAFVILGYFARPTALMLVLLLGVVTVALYRGEERKRMLLDIGMGLSLCVVSALVYEKVYLQWASGGSMSYGSESVLFRYRYLRFFDLRRLLWVMIPGGFLGFLALFAFRRHDRFSRQLSAVVLLYFLAFFVPAFVALHHFVPVMVLPVVVLLRTAGEAPGWLRHLALTGCVVGVLLSLPRSLHVDRSSRAIGARMAFGVGDYLGTPNEHRAALDARTAIFELFPATWDVDDRSRVLVGAPMPFLYYSARSGVSLDDADYAILPEAAAAPDGFSEAGRADGAVAYFRSRRVWEADLADTPPVEFGNPLFVLPRETLFWFMGVPAGAYDLHMGTVPVLWRFF